ncbi:hypothetical protein WN51_05699 [Melipona quadrifasciata]|uniref:Uncharacterized protein n=1 Tax=Melipona quadrifasciata TaxID=166423 RepID=A0A0N0BKS2_9HYME|nr:hypothetical protein WN51_05699 [Melipona quadrifasciata]
MEPREGGFDRRWQKMCEWLAGFLGRYGGSHVDLEARPLMEMTMTHQSSYYNSDAPAGGVVSVPHVASQRLAQISDLRLNNSASDSSTCEKQELSSESNEADPPSVKLSEARKVGSDKRINRSEILQPPIKRRKWARQGKGEYTSRNFSIDRLTVVAWRWSPAAEKSPREGFPRGALPDRKLRAMALNGHDSHKKEQWLNIVIYYINSIQCNNAIIDSLFSFKNKPPACDAYQCTTYHGPKCVLDRGTETVMMQSRLARPVLHDMIEINLLPVRADHCDPNVFLTELCEQISNYEERPVLSKKKKEINEKEGTMKKDYIASYFNGIRTNVTYLNGFLNVKTLKNSRFNHKTLKLSKPKFLTPRNLIKSIVIDIIVDYIASKLEEKSCSKRENKPCRLQFIKNKEACDGLQRYYRDLRKKEAMGRDSIMIWGRIDYQDEMEAKFSTGRLNSKKCYLFVTLEREITNVTIEPPCKLEHGSSGSILVPSRDFVAPRRSKDPFCLVSHYQATTLPMDISNKKTGSESSELSPNEPRHEESPEIASSEKKDFSFANFEDFGIRYFFEECKMENMNALKVYTEDESRWFYELPSTRKGLKTTSFDDRSNPQFVIFPTLCPPDPGFSPGINLGRSIAPSSKSFLEEELLREKISWLKKRKEIEQEVTYLQSTHHNRRVLFQQPSQKWHRQQSVTCKRQKQQESATERRDKIGQEREILRQKDAPYGGLRVFHDEAVTSSKTVLDRRDSMKTLNMLTAVEEITYEQILFVIASFNCGNGEQRLRHRYEDRYEVSRNRFCPPSTKYSALELVFYDSFLVI